MKKILANMIAPILVFGLILACDDDEITSSFDTLDIPPVVGTVTPNGSVKVGEGFDITVKVSDGEQSPLQSVSITLKDSSGVELGSTTIPVSGVADSVGWAAADNGSAALTVADYTITVVATDVVNLSSAPFVQAFNVFDLPFNANYPTMYLLGSFTGWGGTPEERADYQFELVADNLWELKDVDLLAGDEFKLSVNSDFDGTVATNEDWSDKDCDGIMESKSGGDQDGNTSCGFKGSYDILFNDDSFSYTMTPTIETAQNVDELYLLGNFNSFVGSDAYKFSLDSNNTWILAEVILKGGDQFFFAEGSSLNNVMSWGDNEPDSVADAGGVAVTLPSSVGEAFYKVTFNDETLEYDLAFVKFPSISIIGSTRTGDDSGWSGDTNLRDFGSGSFRHAMGFYEGAFKFRQNQSWDNQWGGVDFPGGTMAVSGGGDIIVSAEAAGTYIVQFNPGTGDVSFTASDIAIIGAATAGGWDADTNMTATADPAVWTITLDLTAGEYKIRTDESWDYNWGPDGYNTPANFNNTEAGNYTITMNINTGVLTSVKN